MIQKEMNFFKLFPFAFLCLLCLSLNAQKTIRLKNPSFEGKPTVGDTPFNWKDCGFRGESPPDIQPCGAFEVSAAASNGATYLGMVTRDNDTWEKVGTKLSSKMEAGIVYEFRIQLCQSETYQSASRLTGEPTNFITPVVLRIFGGNSYCEKEQLLGVSPVVDHKDWETYRFTLSPQQGFSHLLLEAYYRDARGEAYCGNILVDNASELIPLGRLEDIDRASTVGEKIVP